MSAQETQPVIPAQTIPSELPSGSRRSVPGRPLRIVFYSPRATYLEPGPSGDRVFVRGILVGLRARGHQVEVVSRTDVRDFWRKRLPARRLLAEAFAVRRAVRRLSPDAWVTFGTSVKYPDLFGWWQRPRRYVLLKADAGDEAGMPQPWRSLFMFAQRRSLARAHVVGVERPRSAEPLRRRGVTDERIRVLPLAAASWDLPSREQARRRLDLSDAARVILCVSRFPGMRDDAQPWKTDGIIAMLDAVANVQLPEDAVLLLAGDGPGRARVEQRVAELALGARVRLLGSVPTDEVRWLFAACDFYAHYTVRDRMFTSIIEAQACGRPVVVSRNPSTELIVDDGRSGFLATDESEFAGFLELLATDEERCAAMGRAAKGYAERLHSMRVRVEQIEELLR